MKNLYYLLESVFSFSVLMISGLLKMIFSLIFALVGSDSSHEEERDKLYYYEQDTKTLHEFDV